MQRILTFYQQNNNSVFVIFIFEILTESLTNDVRNFEQKGPGQYLESVALSEHDKNSITGMSKFIVCAP